MKKRTFIKLTHDWWYGNFNGNGHENQVELLYLGNINAYDRSLHPIYRVMVSGTDDFKMDFNTHDEKKAIKMLHKLRELGFLDIDELEKLGFKIY